MIVSVIFTFESLQLCEFLTDLQDSGLENHFQILGMGLFANEAVHVIIIFQYLTKCRTIYFEEPCRETSLMEGAHKSGHCESCMCIGFLSKVTSKSFKTSDYFQITSRGRMYPLKMPSRKKAVIRNFLTSVISSFRTKCEVCSGKRMENVLKLS